MDKGVIYAFKRLHLRHIFRQVIKSINSDEKLTLEEFGKHKFDIYKATKNIDFA